MYTEASARILPCRGSSGLQRKDSRPHLRGNILHDGHTAVLMREHGVTRIVTRDTDFHKFKFLEVVDPIDG